MAATVVADEATDSEVAVAVVMDVDEVVARAVAASVVAVDDEAEINRGLTARVHQLCKPLNSTPMPAVGGGIAGLFST